MAKKFSIKSLIDTDYIIYVAPILTIVSLLNVFNHDPTKHSFGQIEIFAALIIVGYYLWDKIAVIYPHELIGKKRLQEMACVVVGIFSALVLFAPLMTWQYYNLYKASDRYSYNKQILAAIFTAWFAIAAMYYSSYVKLSERMAAQNAPAAESSYVAPTAPTQGQ